MMALTRDGRVGIGTTTPQSKLDISAQDGLRIRGYQPYLTLTDANAGDARTVIQNANGNFALFTAADLPSGIPTLTINPSSGLFAQNQSTAANATAVLGEITSSSPGSLRQQSRGSTTASVTMVWVCGVSNTGTAIGVYGSASNGAGVYAVSSTGYGLLAGSTYGVGIKGLTGGAYSVVGQNYNSGNTFGALGYHGDFPSSNQSAGVFAYADGSNAIGGALGCRQQCYTQRTFQGTVFVGGDLFVVGTFSVTGEKNFMIDHPLDPANKYLIHSCVESPDRMNIYNGNVTTDASGLATVELPSYFEALNIDYRYQLTVIGQFAQAIVESEIQNNRFTIRTDKPNVKVSWQVTGVRNDAYAKAHPMVVEKEKDVKDRGKYLMPELFGQPPEKGIHYMPPSRLPGPEKVPPAGGQNK